MGFLPPVKHSQPFFFPAQKADPVPFIPREQTGVTRHSPPQLTSLPSITRLTHCLDTTPELPVNTTQELSENDSTQQELPEPPRPSGPRPMPGFHGLAGHRRGIPHSRRINLKQFLDSRSPSPVRTLRSTFTNLSTKKSNHRFHPYAMPGTRSSLATDDSGPSLPSAEDSSRTAVKHDGDIESQDLGSSENEENVLYFKKKDRFSKVDHKTALRSHGVLFGQAARDEADEEEKCLRDIDMEKENAHHHQEEEKTAHPSSQEQKKEIQLAARSSALVLPPLRTTASVAALTPAPLRIKKHNSFKEPPSMMSSSEPLSTGTVRRCATLNTGEVSPPSKKELNDFSIQYGKSSHLYSPFTYLLLSRTSHPQHTHTHTYIHTHTYTHTDKIDV